MAKLFGSLGELVKVIFRADNQEVGLEPNSSTTYTAARDIELPPGDADQVLVSATSTQTLTNKTIDGDDNTVQDLPDTAIKTNVANANKFFTRDGSGVPTSAAKDVPTGTVVGTSDTQTLTNKTIDADSNTITNIEDADIKAGAAIAATKIADGSVDNTEFQRLGSVTSALVGVDDTQTLTNKTLTSPEINTAAILLNQAALQLREQTGNGSNYVALTAPDSVSTNVTWKLPDADGSGGEFLQTDGSGNLTWAAAGTGGTVTTDLSTTTTTVASGTTLFHPNLIIDTGVTYTINGRLTSEGVFTVDGTLIVNGTTRVL